MEHFILYKDFEAYSCFPAIAKARDGSLWVTFRRAGNFSLKAVQEGKYDHVDKGARIGLLNSIDQGKTWNEKKYSRFLILNGENKILLYKFFQMVL